MVAVRKKRACPERERNPSARLRRGTQGRACKALDDGLANYELGDSHLLKVGGELSIFQRLNLEWKTRTLNLFTQAVRQSTCVASTFDTRLNP